MPKSETNHWFAHIVAANRQDLDTFFSGPARLLCVLSTLLDIPTAALLERPAIRFFGHRFFSHHFRRAFGNRLRPEMELLGNEWVENGVRIHGAEVLTRAARYRATPTRRLKA